MPRKTHQHLILVTCITSALAAIICMVSLGTEEWVSAEGVFTLGVNLERNYVNYGLFGGTLNRYTADRAYFQITMTCNSEEQVCAMLCKGTSEGREEQLQQLIDKQPIMFDGSCPKVQRNIRLADQPRLHRQTPRATEDRTFIDYGIYVSTVAFLVIGIVVGIAAVGLSVWNTIGNPIHSIFNVYGIIGMNAAATVSVALSMILWAVQYHITLTENVGILETITQEMETLLPALGYSYWINLASIFLYASSIGLIVCRKLLVDREPEATNLEMINSDDRTIVLF